MLTAITLPAKTKFEVIELVFFDADIKPPKPLKPLVAARVSVVVLGADGQSAAKPIFERTNTEGKVTIRILVPAVALGKPAAPLPKLRVTVLDLDGDKLLEQEAQPEPDKPLSFQVSDGPQQVKIQSPIGDGTLVLGRTFSPGLAKLLGQNKIASLAVLRSVNLNVFDSLSDKKDKQDLAELIGHSQLQLVSRNHTTNQVLLKAGISSIFDIVNSPRSVFIQKLKGQIPGAVAKALHSTAKRQMQVLNNIAIEQKVNRANGITTGSSSTARAMSAATDPTNTTDTDEPSCECDCNSALSPQAYLVDLLDFAVENVLSNSNSIDLPKLEKTFGQPFGALPVDCDFANQLVRQVRLCIDALKKSDLIGPLNLLRLGKVRQAHRAHAERAYESLLHSLGTNYRELRLVHSDEKVFESLAERLGLAPEVINRFRLELITADVEKRLTEDLLDRLFGLQSTARDPLSTGAKFNDDQAQIVRWQLRGVKWRKTTDELGRIYISLVKRSNGEHQVILYRHQRRSNPDRLAIGRLTEAAGTVPLAPLNNSGLAGRIEFNYTVNDTDIYLAAIPEWAVCRKAHLRKLWLEADNPVSGFTSPIIDPDVVFDTDLMMPFTNDAYTNVAYDLWMARKADLDTKRGTLDDKDTIEEMLKDTALFGVALNIAEWGAIANKLKSSDANEVSIAMTDLENLDQHLTPQTFRFLYELWGHELDGQEIRPEEREPALDVLVNIYKVKQFTSWLSDETDEGIRLSPPYFYLSDEQPTLNPLRASAEQRDEWRAELERNCTLPLIDPDIISVSNFALGSDSTPAYLLWDSRRQLVDALFTSLTGIDTAAKLEAALTNGDLPAGQPAPLFHSIGLKVEELATVLEAFKSGSNLPFPPEQIGLTRSELRMLVEVLQLAANAHSSDWEQVHHILVQAEKQRYLYPEWRTEEQDANITLTPDIFVIPSDTLAEDPPILPLTPGFIRWRLDLRRQRDWRTQLQARIQQEHAVAVELQAAIDAAEEASLPSLRDDLVLATVSEDEGGLEERKRWVMNHLLINAFENGCRKTTRAAQAIETIQLLIWGIYSGQVESTNFSLEPASAETFIEQWQWSGSYATWRSAMFIYLYPENLLLPELRRAIEDHPNLDTDPTLLFKAIMKVLSGQALRSTAEPADDNPTDTSQSEQTEDDELAPIIDEVYLRLGNLDPQSLEGQKKILYLVLTYWRDKYRRVQYIDNAGPIPDWENKWNALHQYAYYKSTSAFLEDFLYIPLSFALDQLGQGHYEDALYWFRTIYSFRGTASQEFQGWANYRLNLYFQQYDATEEYSGIYDWLNDSLNPHLIAATRKGANIRFVLLCIVRCLLEYADSEFAKDNSESLARARELYESARRQLDSGFLGKGPQDCRNLLQLDIARALAAEPETGTLTTGVVIAVLEPYLDESFMVSNMLEKSARDRLLVQILDVVKPAIPPKPPAKVKEELHTLFAGQFQPGPPQTAEVSRNTAISVKEAAYQDLLAYDLIFQEVQQVNVMGTTISPLFTITRSASGSTSTQQPAGDPLPGLGLYSFCIPRNPLIGMLRLRYEVSWFKLNNCMNLAGQFREVPSYAAPTDTYSGLPVAEIGSTTGFSAAARFVPTQYRYRALIERARQLIALAQQMEATYLSFLEKRDQEAYTILHARQDLGIANANVTLQNLKVTEADNGKELADEQWNRANETVTHYEDLLKFEDLASFLEVAAYLSAYTAAAVKGVAALAALVAGFSAGATVTGVFSALATAGIAAVPGAVAGGAAGGGSALIASGVLGGGDALSLLSGAMSMHASIERRNQEWKFQKDIANIDIEISRIQQTLSKDRYNIVVQEKRISEMSAENASDVTVFLNTKFTNAELYAWMGGIVGSIYRYMLQEATTIAKLAQRQLAFERQQVELTLVQDDYWTYTDTSAILRGNSATTERRGMTGSARLLQDTTRLDQEAFLTDRRKLQLSKTFSLALLDPVSFGRFRQSGALLFSTKLDHFDRDFPGHYLRLIKRVRVSVIALVPPTEGIRATLSSTGISQVVREGDPFKEVEIVHDPETIAFTSPINATGVFELVEQPDILLPFEGNGVAASWVFSMPRAANVVDYGTIADILVTIEYTAFNSEIFRQQVIQKLDRRISNERPFSFRFQFADAWYDLNNSELLEDNQQMKVAFETRRSDFPPNVTDLKIAHVSLFFVRKDGFTETINVNHLLFTETGRAGTLGGAASTNDGLISTRNSNAGSWLAMQGKQPIGAWELQLPTEVAKKWFKEEMIEDILFVITFDGTTSAWTS